ncbi:putative transcriptional regulator [Alkalihalobacillus xiaoxiensis]|uniref:Transcriptional regulator n=1 Tax=Shouchella xiaoxiensis TaxID=766895 RepID=A0ABS2SVR5_9BACI|nr:putative transcriptional regulator [Shouchella xiaoxiensis]
MSKFVHLRLKRKKIGGELDYIFVAGVYKSVNDRRRLLGACKKGFNPSILIRIVVMYG